MPNRGAGREEEKKTNTFFDANRIFYVLFTSKLPKYALPLNLFHS